jgi:phosphoglycolate phosphatase-like HAD superfamily hydrolase
MPERKHTVLFDFDGTISLGAGPVLAYARAVSETLSASQSAAFLEAVSAGLPAQPADAATRPTGGSGALTAVKAIDGYDLVRILSVEYAVDPLALSAAYLSSRRQLATPLAPVSAPEGLAGFLAGIRDRAFLVVATNAPETRLDEAIEALGLAGSFDDRYTSVGKPGGLDRVLDEWLPHGPLLSVGDVWGNDLAPAHARGAATALVGAPVDDAAVTPTFRAETLPQLYPEILSWLDDSPSSTIRTALPHRTTER